MVYTLKGEEYFHYFSNSFAKDWNKLSSKNAHLGRLELNHQESWHYGNAEGSLRNLLNILLRAYYDTNKTLLNSLVAQNVLELKDKYSDDLCQIIVINLDKAKKVLESKKQIQGQKWPRILLGVSKYSVFKGVCICALKGHEDPEYNRNYDKLMAGVLVEVRDIFEEYSRLCN